MRSQNVEAGFLDDLSEEFEQHVVVRLLDVALVIHLQTRRLVHVVATLVHVARICTKHTSRVVANIMRK